MKYNKLYENWNRHLEEELEENLSEEGSEFDHGLVDNAEVIKLLSQINDKLDGLEDIDTSIDYLIGGLTGDSALSAKVKQATLGRFGDADPRLAELIKKYQE
tara:strand:- start:3 stop:308 length:306 start_codon:yes stop_codon:yes gene_type:complete